MQPILGDKTILSLLDILEMGSQEKEEIKSSLLFMDDADRKSILETLLKLFSLQAGKKVTLKQAEMIIKNAQNPGVFNWNEFTRIEDDVLDKMTSKTQE